MSDPLVLGAHAWRETWTALGGVPDEALRMRIITSYDEPHRHYHTSAHLRECLEELKALQSWLERNGTYATSGAEIAIALWFHDVVYDPKRSDNEAVSADRARAELLERGVDAATADRVHALVLATHHTAVPDDADQRLLVDIDLSILGAASPRFDEYEEQVRAEYQWVPGFIFRRERRKILQQFLDRVRIYQTAPFFERLETRARTNLRRSIEQLGG
jgi:predicted metal-dependent HD superfamily phosphohydrolase